MSDIIRALKRGDDCPELNELFEAMERDSADPSRRQAEEHMKNCSGCQTEWTLFQQFEAGEPRADEREAVAFIVKQVQAKRAEQRRGEAAEERRSFWQRFLTPAWLGGAALAMAAVVMSIGLISQWQARHATSAVYNDQETLRSEVLEFSTRLDRLTSVPDEIAWKAVPGAASYTVLLTEVDDTKIVYTKVTSLSLSLPDQVRRMLAQGQLLLLTVTASDASGREIARSAIVRMRLRTNEGDLK